MPLLPFGEWLPDQPDFNNPGATTVQNVYPRTSNGAAVTYGPVASLTATTNVLNARCQGALGLRAQDGTAFDFAADASKLYKLTASGGFSDISKVGGYHVGSDQAVDFAIMGNRVIATNIADPIQTFLIGTDSIFSDLNSAAPQARYAAVIKDFLMVGNTTGGTADTSNPGDCPQRLWWSAIGDATSWPTLATSAAAGVQSDAQDVVGDHGALTGIVPNVGPVDALAFFQGAVFRIMYVGSDSGIFSILPAHGVKGCVAPESIVNTPVGTFYYSPEGFKIYDGQSLTPIGYGKVDQWFKSNLDTSNILRIVACPDPLLPIVWVAFPSLMNSGGNPDTILACNYGLTSVLGTPGVWSMVTGITVEYLFRAVSLGYTLEQLDQVSASLDALPISLDSQIWQGNAQFLLGAFDTSHALNFFTGNNLAPLMETSETQLLKGKRSNPTTARPIVDGGSITLTPYVRQRILDSIVAKTSSTVDANGYCYFKDADAFYHRFRGTMPSNSIFNHAQGVDIDTEDIVESGER